MGRDLFRLCLQYGLWGRSFLTLLWKQMECIVNMPCTTTSPHSSAVKQDRINVSPHTRWIYTSTLTSRSSFACADQLLVTYDWISELALSVSSFSYCSLYSTHLYLTQQPLTRGWLYKPAMSVAHCMELFTAEDAWELLKHNSTWANAPISKFCLILISRYVHFHVW